MDLNQLEVFVRIYETGNFSRAAREMFLTQPTVSAHLRHLEKSLNTKLFHRTTKSVTPTDAGRHLYPHAKELLKKRDELLNEFRAAYGNVETLSIGGSTIPARYILPGLMNGFTKQNPNVRFELISGDSSEILRQLTSGKLRIGFIGSSPEHMENLQFRSFYTDFLVFITPNTPFYRRLIRSTQPIPKLLEQPIILRENIGSDMKKGDRFLEQLGYQSSDLNVVARMNEQEEIKKAVQDGLGISLMSKIAAEDAKRDGRILLYNPVSVPMRRHLYIATRKDEQLTVMEEKFLRFIRNNT